MEQRLVAVEPLRGDPGAVGQLERDVLPLGRDAEAELDVSQRGAGEGLKATTIPCGASAAASRAASSARPIAICSASSQRTSTWVETSSTEQPQIESCAEFSISRRHARSSSRSGHAVPYSAWNGSA